MTELSYWQRMRASKLSRRTLLSASGRAGVGAAGLALVGCGDDDDELAPAVVTQAQQQQQVQQQQAQEQAPAQARQQAQQAVQQADTQARQARQARQAQPTQQAQEAEPQTVAEGPAITRGGKLRLTTTAPAHDYFDPHRAIFGTTQSWMAFYMNYLIRWRNKEQGIMEADVASLPETPDEETYVFTLDQGARISGIDIRLRAGAQSPPRTSKSTSSARSPPPTPAARKTAPSPAHRRSARRPR